MCRVNLSLCFLVFLMGIAFLVAVPSVSQADGADDALSAVSEAALRQDWNGVLSLVEKHPGVLNDPVGRAIAGHAYLATNRNNLSYGMFASLDSAADLERYASWTEQLIAPGNVSRQGNAVGQYFRGDALARKGQWEAAIRHFSRAKETDSRLALAWNALGVAYAYADNFKEAKTCFKQAITADGDFADAYASLGTLLLTVEAAPGALANYQKALDHSHSFALANNGRACAKLGHNRDQEAVHEVMADFDAALACNETAELVAGNIRRLFAACLGIVEDEVRPEALKGMTVHARDLVGLPDSVVDAQLGRMSASDRQRILNETNRHAGNVELGRFLFGGSDARIGFEMGVGANVGLANANARVFGQGGQTMQGFEAHLDTRAQELSHLRERTLVHQSPGGADTVAVALENSSGDIGEWPTKDTRFGLIPLANLPKVTKPGD